MSIFGVYDGKMALNNAARDSEKHTELTGDLRENLQNTLLGMYVDLKKVCDRYNLKAYLCGGSALGCVRHGGFIPWDDDLDVAMTRNDYNKLKVVFAAELGDKNILNAPDISEHPITRFPKILKKGTRFVNYGGVYKPESSMIYLDIFLIENIPNSLLIRTIKGVAANFCEAVSAQIEIKNGWSYLKDIYLKDNKLFAYMKYYAGFICSALPYEKWLKIIDRLIQHRNDNSEYCGLVTGRKHYFGEILKREAFFPGTVGVFAGHEADLFQNTDEYLTNLYGEDYMTPPPIEKRECHYITELVL